MGPGPKREPMFLTVTQISAALGVCTKTLYAYLQRGILNGARIPSHRAWHSSPVMGVKPVWRVSLASVYALLATMYTGGVVPPGVRRRLRGLAKPLPKSPPQK